MSRRSRVCLCRSRSSSAFFSRKALRLSRSSFAAAPRSST
eukprot:CAMPEP_0113284216 /NCGR_PEP_ID=MMETSP0008_2-20120614/29891_1 /TAXON_ID=97485 /ORGANISM="Prymnesium parvum" /LENGTH=39 /DNA_ID=CAMNT_0000135035 /DNA_START=280 /DNA_END=395 /DNA_ORIENTATION=- /assembly_acc=CAM_ASM_000153